MAKLPTVEGYGWGRYSIVGVSRHEPLTSKQMVRVLNNKGRVDIRALVDFPLCNRCYKPCVFLKSANAWFCSAGCR